MRADRKTQWEEKTDRPDVRTENDSDRQPDRLKQTVSPVMSPLELWNTCGESWDDATF